MNERLPTYFISHGGGPWPWMPEMAASLQPLAISLADIPRQLAKPPRAVLLITAHWEAPAFTLSTNPAPGMLYDYGGFPQHTYEVVYPAPGAPELATQVQSMLQAAGLPTALDAHRGYDHGTFVPMAVMYPEAQIPVLQASLRCSLDPEEHLAFGRALAPLRDENVLIIGSGLSYHNLHALGPAAREPSRAFDGWLQETLTAAPAMRKQRLCNWQLAPSARQCHPREDHLLPLMVAAGAAETDSASCVYHQNDAFGSLTVSSFKFG